MNSKIITLSRYRLDRAKEDLLSAKVNLENGLIKASINRSYYSIFHAIRAINALNEFDSKKHSGVISHFNQFFIHTGNFDKQVYSLISIAYKIRERSDYDDFYVASKRDAQSQLENANYFLKLAEEFLLNKYKDNNEWFRNDPIEGIKYFIVNPLAKELSQRVQR